jgi:uncharacterized protein (DUF2237 family)
VAFDSEALNVLGEPLEGCCNDPLTGFYRDGYCHTGAQDLGVHTVCAVVSDAFLAFSRERGNDLTTPRPEFGFPGLQDGDGWCLCAGRWLEAHEAGAAPRIKLRSTHIRTLDLVPLSVLKPYALDLS